LGWEFDVVGQRIRRATGRRDDGEALAQLPVEVVGVAPDEEIVIVRMEGFGSDSTFLYRVPGQRDPGQWIER